MGRGWRAQHARDEAGDSYTSVSNTFVRTHAKRNQVCVRTRRHGDVFTTLTGIAMTNLFNEVGSRSETRSQVVFIADMPEASDGSSLVVRGASGASVLIRDGDGTWQWLDMVQDKRRCGKRCSALYITPGVTVTAQCATPLGSHPRDGHEGDRFRWFLEERVAAGGLGLKPIECT